MATTKPKNILELVCRACLKMSKARFNIFDHKRNDRLLADMLVDCTSVEIHQEDGFPVNICTDCMEKLTSAFNFKTTVLQSNRRLYSFYQRKGNEKETGFLNNNIDDILIKGEIFVKNEQLEQINESALEISDERRSTHKSEDDSPVKNFCCKNDDIDRNRTIKEEKLDDKSQFESADEIGFTDDSDDTSSSSEESSEIDKKDISVKRENPNRIKPVAKQKKRRGNINNHNEKQAELLDNPDYLRIINSGLSKKEKDRETVFCAECNKTLSFRYYVAIHAYTHTGNVPYKCDKCEKCYPKESLLRKHVRSHFQTRDFACDECGKAFFKKQQLQYHKASKHSEERPHRCNICDKTFKIPSALWKHALIHVNDKKYVCEICGKAFVEMVGLTKHKVTHTTEKNFICTTCGKAFMRKRTLGWHLKKHLDDKPYICSYCGKRFHCTTILKNHILIHTGAKPFACEICGKTFRQRSCIARHMRIHTGETPYPCKLCPSSFKYSHHLVNHMKVHEKELLAQDAINLKSTTGDQQRVRDC